jgi:hypothetical protein
LWLPSLVMPSLSPCAETSCARVWVRIETEVGMPEIPGAARPGTTGREADRGLRLYS